MAAQWMDAATRELLGEEMAARRGVDLGGPEHSATRR